MKKRDIYYMSNESLRMLVPNKAFDLCAEKTVDEEQIQRILKPVIQMILSGNLIDGADLLS